MLCTCCSFLPILATAVMFNKGHGNRFEESAQGESPLGDRDADLNLEDVVVDFLENYKAEIGASLWDFDLTGQNKNCPWEKNHRQPVKALFSNVHLLKSAEIRSTKPVVAYTQLFHNGQPDRNETAKVEKKTTRLNTVSYTVDRGITTGTGVTFSAEVLGFLEVSSHLSLQFSTIHGTTKLESKSKTFSINTQVNIPPESTVRVDWIITEEVVDIPWQVDVDLNGHFAGQFERKNGEKFWEFFHVKDLLGHPNLASSEDGVYFQAKGFFKKISASRNHVVIREKLHNPKDPSKSETKRITNNP